jgi:hypothetical protein
VEDEPSCGVTTTAIVVLDPVVSGMAPDAVPEVTTTVCTVTVAPMDFTVGVTVTDATLFGTVEVYDVVPDVKATFSVPSLSVSAVNWLDALSAAARVTNRV